MTIGVDGGALCSSAEHRYGTYRFTERLLAALQRYGKHQYVVYQFCTPDQPDSKSVSYTEVTPAFAWHHLRLPIQLQQDKIPVFLGLNQVAPSFFPGKKIVFSHGLSFHLHPEEYKEDFYRLESQLQQYIKSADVIVVSSERVKQELLDIQTANANKIVVLPFGIDIDRTIPRDPQNYLLYVGSGQPIKRVDTVIRCAQAIREQYPEIRLILAGTKRENVPDFVEQIPHADEDTLRDLYAHASVYVSASRYESFNYPIVEALSSECPVVAFSSACIPEQLPFVTAVQSLEEMIQAVKTVVKQPKPIDVSAVRTVFSWERYVRKLEELYI